MKLFYNQSNTLRNSLLKKNTNHIINQTKRLISSAEIRNNIEIQQKEKYNKYTQKEKYNKEFQNQHKYGPIQRWLSKWFYYPFEMGWFNCNKDNDMGNAAYNAGGAYPNKLSNIFYRSKILQSNFFINLSMRFLDRRNSIQLFRTEPQPKITTNSVFVYKNPSTYLINRRGLERLFLFFVLAKGLNFSGVILYVSIGFYLCLIVRFLFNF